MKVTYIEPVSNGKKITERIFGCSYANYLFPNIYILGIFAILKRRYELNYNQDFLYFKNDKALKTFLDKDGSDVYLVFSVNLSMDEDMAFAKKILEYKKDCFIIFMGPAPTYFYERFAVDRRIFAVRGEPDYTVPELLDALAQGRGASGIPGVSFLKDDEIIHNDSRGIIENLDSLPFPDRGFLRKNHFYNPKLKERPFTVMLTSRGCSHSCIYCVPCALSFARELEFKKGHKVKPPVRLRSAENVIEEFKLLKTSGYKTVSIIDDQFVWGAGRTIEICKGVKGLELSWGCLSRADHLEEAVVKAMSEAGCRYVDIGVESFVQDILDYTKKDVTVQQLIAGIKLLKKYNIFVKLNILFGASPYETIETINYTLKKVKETGPDQVMFDVCSPFPGTEFYEIAKREKWIKGNDYVAIDVASSANINYPHLAAGQLEEAVKKANREFFFNPKFIVKNMLRLKRPGAIIDALKATFRKTLKL